MFLMFGEEGFAVLPMKSPPIIELGLNIKPDMMW